MAETTKHYPICPLCEATCRLDVQVTDGVIGRIAGDREDTFSGGFICPKGAALGQLHADPDRLRMPLVREAGGEFREVSWAEAFAHIEQHLLPSIGDNRAAAGIYLGNPTVHSMAGVLMPRGLIKALGTRNIFTASTVDQMPKHAASGLMYGDPHGMTVPDIDRTDYLLMLGANPWESNGSMCTAPDFPGRLKALLARGGRLVVVDPRRTRTAQHASEHIPIVPGSDAYLLLGLIHVLGRDGLVAPGAAAEHLADVDAVVELARPFSPALVSQMTGIAVDVIERVARELSSTPRAVVYGRIGTQTVSFGTLAAWAVEALNALTGNLDTPGGAMWPLPPHLPKPVAGTKRGFSIGRWRSRVKGYPEVMGEFPVATLADEIETEGPGQVRVLITVAGNPVLSTPGSARLDSALSQLAFMVSVDPYLNETTRHAHVILPPPSALTRNHYDIALSRLAVHNHARWSERVMVRSGPSEEEIMARLQLIASGEPATADPQVVFDRLEQQFLAGVQSADPRLRRRSASQLAEELVAQEPLDRVLEIMIRGGAYGDAFGEVAEGLTFERLREHPHGIDLGPIAPALPHVLATPSGKVELMPDVIREEISRLSATLDAGPKPSGFTLIGRRELRSNNSWMHNLPLLMKGKPRCTLLMHPSDAARLALENGQPVRMHSDGGALVVPVEITDTIMAGVVSLPHGYGHGYPGTTQRLAATTPGVNFNVLTNTVNLDPVSGNAVLTGISVTLEPA